MKDNQSNVNNGAMRPHHSLKILTIGFTIIALLLSLMATMAIHYTSQLADLNKKMYRHPFAVSNAVLTIDALIITMHRDMKDVVLARTSKDLELAVKRVKECELQVLKEFQIISKRFLGSSTKITSALKAFIDWRNIRQEVIELSRTGKYTQAAAITQGKGAVHVKLLLNHMDALVAFARNKAKAFYEQSQLTSEKITSQLWLWFIGIFSAALCVFLGSNYGIRKMEKALRKSQESYQDLYDNAPDMFVSVDPNTAEILQCNQTLVNKIGYSKEELIGKPIFFVYHPDCMDKVKKAFNQFVTTGQVANAELQLKRKDGSKIYVILNVTAAYDEKGNILHSRSIWRDITARKAAEDKLEHLAHYDALTDLPNRAFFQDYLHLLMAKTKRQTNLLAVSYLDLDGFKEVNDTFGHLVGDKLLITIAERLKETLREEDAIARLGGDEFICVFTGLKAPLEIVPILKRLLTVIAAPITINNHEMQVSTSIGSTFYPQKQEVEVEAEQLIRQADQAMYQAKLAGKNSYKFFNPQQDFAIKEQYKQLATIEKALKNDEFQLCYLPKVNMHTGKILGVEALMRWQTADKELLLPGQFLPYIENKAISIRLGEWVINAVLKQMHDWQKGGMELPVSLNISTYHFLQPNFTKRLSEILDAYPPIPHQLLELELLGLKILKDLTQTSQTIENCRSKGIQVALDNFGTGSSSLAYLTHFNVNTLKIDQKIVLDMLKQEKAFRIIGSIIDLANNFNLNVIASGVATEKHGLALMELGCNIGQGYAISPPLSAKELLSWCKIWRPYPSWLK